MNGLTRHNNIFVKINLLVSVLCASVVNSSAQDFKTIKPGIEYAEVTKEISGLKVNMNLLRLDLTKVRLDVHHAMDAAIGTEKTSSIATRHGAFAAINAGFFRMDTSIWAGENVGTLMIDTEILSEPTSNRITISIKNGLRRTEVAFGKLRFVGYIQWKRDMEIDILRGVNRERKSDEVVAFTPVFGKTTLTNPDGLEVIIRKDRVVGKGIGSSNIPIDGFVLSGSGETVKFLEKLQIGDVVKLNWDAINDQKPNLSGPAEDTVAGVPQLIRDGKIDITWEQEKTTKSFVETRHPRTAVAKLKDGKFLMITVDGRTESSGGIGLQDLAEYLLSLGATDAMNLDGGGSTTMFVDGKVVNKPSDKEGERKVSDAILVTHRTSITKKN